MTRAGNRPANPDATAGPRAGPDTGQELDDLPTPVGHSLAGLAITLASGELRERKHWPAALGLIALANLPDADFLPGYLIGEPRAYHWGPAHGLAAALAAALCAGALARAAGARFRRFFLLGLAAYSSHLVFDMLLGPGAMSIGLQVLWPLSGERFSAPWAVFLMLPRSVEHVDPLRALFSTAVLPLVTRELAVLLPVCLGAWLLSRRIPTPAPRAARPRFAPRDPADCEG